ncbi:MAG: TIGR03915 family putative DNA repair protein [Cyclobacteriaceae bacterium]|jgi:probable DNA metabolism protein
MTYIYDGTFPGLLTVIFETYRLKQKATAIVSECDYQPGLFGSPLFVDAQPSYADRVITKLQHCCGQDIRRFLYHCYLSEQPRIEMLIYQFAVLAIESNDNILENFREPVIRQLHRIERQMHREVHRMHAFVRFQETNDGCYVALVSPDFNVLPLLGPHFQARYPALRWLIYDTTRHYGLYHESKDTRYVTLNATQHHILTDQMITSVEADYQALWQTYYKKVDIPERRNLKLHLQHVPTRYWKYLIEKQGK